MKVSCLILLSIIAAVANVAVCAESPTSSAVFEDWLFQADGHPGPQHIQKEIGWARQIAARIGNGADLKSELNKLDKLEKQLSSLSIINSDVFREIYFAVRHTKRAIMFKDPLVDFDEILLIDNPYPGAGREPGHEARHAALHHEARKLRTAPAQTPQANQKHEGSGAQQRESLGSQELEAHQASLLLQVELESQARPYSTMAGNSAG